MKWHGVSNKFLNDASSNPVKVIFVDRMCVGSEKFKRSTSKKKKKKDHALFRHVNKTIPDDTVVTTPIYHAHKILSYNWLENKYCLQQDNLPIAVSTQNFLP